MSELSIPERRDLEPYKALVLLLEQAGWETHEITIDTNTRRVRMIFESFKGRQVMFDSDALGRSSTTREQREMNTVATGRRGDRFLAERLSYRFLGREKHVDPLTGLRWLAEYLGANGTRELPSGVLAKALTERVSP